MTAIGTDEETFSIAGAAERTGVSTHTLRYYERIGLLEIDRLPSGHRRYSAHDLDAVVFIGRLRATAMPIREIQRYFNLATQGSSTERERLQMLVDQRIAIHVRLGELKDALKAIEIKIVYYNGSCGP